MPASSARRCPERRPLLAASLVGWTLLASLAGCAATVGATSAMLRATWQRAPQPDPLLGYLTRADLRAYEPWQALYAEPYAPDPVAVKAIGATGRGVEVLIVVGTWCPDSRREIPRFFAILDAAGLAAAKLTIIGVDRTKRDTEGLTEKWSVTRVPTFIFLRAGKELGRIVERVPAESTLEAEIARIVGGSPAG